MKLPFISEPNAITNDDYHNGEKWKGFASSSVLKNYNISPKYARYTQLNPELKTGEGIDFGSIYHDILASITNVGDWSDFYKTSFVFDAPINPTYGTPYGYNTEKYQEAMNEQMAENPGKTVCSQKMVDKAKIMLKELMHNNSESHIIRGFIEHGKAEVSSFCEYEGQLFKIRKDLETRTRILDWKTVGQLKEAKENKFFRTITKRGYDVSGAMYQFIDHAITGRWKNLYWVVQETMPPYDFVIHDASEWTWKIYKDGKDQIVEPRVGAMRFLKLMNQHIKCCEDGIFPGYSVFIEPDWRKMRIAKPEVPIWYENEKLEFYN